MKLTLVKKIQNTFDASSFIFEPEKPIKWKAGQYLYYTLNHHGADERGVSRYFTNSAAPHEKFIMITTRLAAEEGSTFKRALQSLAIGAQIDAFPPDGDFVVDDPGAKYVFIAGGIGITPFRSILLDLGNKKEIKDIILFYGNRNEEIVFKDELEKIAGENPGLKIKYAIEPERINAQIIKSEVPDMAERIFYISGPEKMVRAFKEMLVGELGISRKNIKTDYFPGYDSI